MLCSAVGILCATSASLHVSPTVCSSQARAHVRSTRRVGGCSKNETWRSVIAAAAVQNQPVRFINAGANKGFEVAGFLEAWAPERNVSKRRWHSRIKAFAAAHHLGFLSWSASGACKDGLQTKQEERRISMYARRGNHVEIHAFELAASTAHLLETIVNDTGVSDIVHVYNRPVDNSTRMVDVPLVATAPGNERFSICHAPESRAIGKRGDSCRRRGRLPTLATSLDDFIEQRGFGHVFQVTIDTEGWDALVLEGLRRSLRSQTVQVVEFEYSAMGFWKQGLKDRRTLAQTLQWMADVGWFCFMQGKFGLVPVSPPCWREEMEIHRWSNLVCVHGASTFFAELLKLVV